MTRNSHWASRLSILKARISDEEQCGPILKDLEGWCADKQFRKSFLPEGHLDIFGSVLQYLDQGPMVEIEMIGEFNANLQAELFHSHRIGLKLSRYLLPAVTSLWYLSTDENMVHSDLLEGGILGYLAKWLPNLYTNYKLLPDKDKLFGGILSVIWNTVSRNNELKYPIRKMLCTRLDTLKEMSEDCGFNHRILALTCVLLLTDAEKKSAFATTSSDLDTLVHALAHTLKSKGHVAVLNNASYQLEELLLMFMNVAENDTSKDILIDLNVVETVICHLESPDTTQSQKQRCLELLYKLSFKVKLRTELANYLKTTIKKLQSKPNNSKELTELCQRITFELCESSRLQSLQTCLAKKSKAFVMISYNWGVQTSAIKLRDLLSANKIPVWIDVDNMGADILSSMAEAVEGASAVIICVTEKYKESSACRSEAEYAYNLHKKVIPVMCEKNYQPTGWLGILVGTKKYFNWYDNTTVELSSPELVSQIRSDVFHSTVHKPRLSQKDEEEVEEQLIEANSVHTLESSKVSGSSPREDFKNWLDQYQLTHYAKSFETFSDEMLLYLKEMEVKSPELLWPQLRDDYHMKFDETIKFCLVLRKL